MEKRKKMAVGIAAAVAVVSGGAGLAFAAGSDDDEALTGSTYDRATAAALEHVGEGTVTETEAGDEGAAYSVEVRRDNGTQVEVDLDDAFEVIGTEEDDDGPADLDEDD